MSNELKTYGDLKSAIKSISLKQKGEKIGGVVLSTLVSLIPGADAAKTTYDLVKAAISKPDTKKTNTWLDTLDIDDEMSSIIDDTVENGFVKIISRVIDSEPNDKELEDDFNMNQKLADYLKSKYDGRFVTGVKENKNKNKMNVKSLIEQVVKEEMAKIQEAKPFKVNKKYNVFAVEKSTNKIVNGWDLDPKDKENIREYITKTSTYVKGDLQDLDLKPSQVDIVSVKTAKSKGLDPFNWDSWKKHNDAEVKEATINLVSNSGVPTQDQKNKVKAKDGDIVVTSKPGKLSEAEEVDVKGIKVILDGDIVGFNIDENKRLHQYLYSDLLKTIEPDALQTIRPVIKGTPLVWVKIDSPSFKMLIDALGRGVRINIDGESNGGIYEEHVYNFKKQLLAKIQAFATKYRNNKKSIELKNRMGLSEAETEDKPAEEEPTPAPAEQSAGLASELNKHISSAIDAAAKCIQDSGDKKYEKVLGKVVKNLTFAQSALEDVQAHENKLNELAAKEDDKSTAKYTKALRTALKGSFKNPEHVEQILEKYKKVIKSSKDKNPIKLAEQIAAHALKEGFENK